MNQAEPQFIIKKYRSILLASITIEIVSYVVSITDTLIAGNFVDSKAMAAIGIVTPLFLFTTFVASVINTGTIINYSNCIGQFNLRRANEIFSQGVILSVFVGILMVAVMYILRDSFITFHGVSGEIADDVRIYYNIIIFFFLLEPLSCLLDNSVVADGGEKLSAVSNIVQIVVNVILSWQLSIIWGVLGIAVASVAAKCLFFLIIGVWFFNPKQNLKIFWHFDWKDIYQIFRSGIVKASIFVMPTFTFIIINAFSVTHFGDEIMINLTVAEKLILMSTIFIGFAMSIQTLIGILLAEKNLKSMRLLMHTVFKDMLLIGILFSLLIVVFAPFLTKAFGIHEGNLFVQCVKVVRIIGATLFIQSILSLFFIYYILLNEQILSFIVGAVKELILPLLLSLLAVLIFESQELLWYGLALSNVVSLIVCGLIVLLRYGKEKFPFLISKKKDDNIFIYYFKISVETSVELSKTVMQILSDKGYPRRIQNIIGILTEDLLLITSQKNSSPIEDEYTLILNNEEVRIILRFSGNIFDITDIDAKVDSLRQYVISNILTATDYKAYIKTGGYNRNVVTIKVR